MAKPQSTQETDRGSDQSFADVFAALLGKTVAPVSMGVLFYAVLTPIALIMRLFATRPMPIGFEPDTQSYWIKRTPPGPAPDSMRKQF